MEKRQIAIVNEHPVVLRGLAEIIDKEDDLHVCAEIADLAGAVQALAAARADLAIVDVSDREISRGIELVKAVKAQIPDLPVLVLSMHDESFYAEVAFRAGARGYVSMAEPTAQILIAIRQALASGMYVSEKMAVDIVSRLVSNGRPRHEGQTLYGFTDREFEIFEYIGRGMSVRQISEKLHRSIKTVEAHREHIKKKLRLDNTTELVRQAIHWVEYQRTASTV
jgi:DNA-binding NarL/FixJ family response regulator